MLINRVSFALKSVILTYFSVLLDGGGFLCYN